MDALLVLFVLLAAPWFVQLVLWSAYRVLAEVIDLGRVIQRPASSA